MYWLQNLEFQVACAKHHVSSLPPQLDLPVGRYTPQKGIESLPRLARLLDALSLTGGIGQKIGPVLAELEKLRGRDTGGSRQT